MKEPDMNNPLEDITWESLQKKYAKKEEPQKEPMVLPEVTVKPEDESPSILEVLSEPGRKLNEGISKMGTNPVVGSLDIINSIGSLAGTPFGLLDAGLRSVGADVVADAISLPFQGINVGVQEGTKGIQKGLEQIGITKDVEDAFWAGKGLTPQDTKEIAQSLNEVNQLALQVTVGGAFAKLKSTIRDTSLPKEVRQQALNELRGKNATETGNIEGSNKPEYRGTDKSGLQEETGSRNRIQQSEKIKENPYKTWLEKQEDVELVQKENLGVTGKGERIGAFTQKTEKGYKVTYADYTPDASFSKEIGRVLANKMTIDDLKPFQTEFKTLGLEGGLKDNFATAVKKITTNPELADRVPNLKKYLEDKQVPFEKVSGTPNAEIPPVAKGLTEQKKISEEFQGTPDKSHYKSLQNFTTDKELNDFLVQTGSVDKPRGRMAWSATEDLAHNLGITTKDILKVRAGETRNVEWVEGARQVVTDNANEISKVYKEQGVTAENGKQLRDMLMTHNSILRKTMGLGSESARVLNILRKPLSPREFDTLNGLFDDLKKRGFDVEKPETLGKALKEALDPNFADKTLYWWYNSLLANPMTDVANIVGNMSYLGWEVGTKTLTEPWNTGSVMRGLGIAQKEFGQEVKKIWNHEQEVISKFDYSTNELRKTYDPNPNNVQNKLVRGILKGGHILLPVNRLRIEDAWNKAVAKNIEKEVSVKKLSKEFDQSKEVTRQQLSELETTIKNDALGKNLTSKEQKFVQAVNNYNDYMHELTFTQPLGKTGASFQNLTSKSALLKWMFPFVRISINLMKEGLKQTPYYLGKELVKEGLGKEGISSLSPRQRTNMMRRAVAGTSFMLGLEYLISQGKVEITGDGMNDKNQRELWLKAGYKPNHVYIKNDKGEMTGIPYSTINPISLLLSIRGNLSDYSKYDTKFNDEDNTIDQKASLVFEKVANTFLDQSFMWGAQQTLKSITDGDANLLGKVLTSPLPNVGGIVRNFKGDYTQYKKKSFWDVVENKLGIDNGQPVTDISGQPKDTGYRRFPFQVSGVKNNVYKYLIDNNIRLGTPTRPKMKNREMTDEEFETYKIKSGRVLEGQLAKNFNRIKGMTKEKAQDFIKNLAENVRKRAKRKLSFRRIK
jgi:hypothetical protein